MERKDKKTVPKDKPDKPLKTDSILNVVIIFLFIIIIAVLIYSLFISKNKSAVNTENGITPFIIPTENDVVASPSSTIISSPTLTPTVPVATVSPTVEITANPTLKIIPPYKFLKLSLTPVPTPN